MKKTALVTAASVALGFSAVAEARTSSDAEFRGLQNCLEAAEKDSNGLVASRQYLISKEGETNYYFVNATRWEDGERNRIRIACETNRQGSQLLSSTVQDGRYDTKDPRVTVEVAQQ